MMLLFMAQGNAPSAGGIGLVVAHGCAPCVGDIGFVVAHGCALWASLCVS
jgi:hypothetical protein